MCIRDRDIIDVVDKQNKPKLDWLEKFEAENPGEIDPSFLKNQKAMEDILFKKYLLKDLPTIWPLSSYKYVYDIIPDVHRVELKDIKLTHVLSYHLAAFANGESKELTLFSGMSDFFLNLAFAITPIDPRIYKAHGVALTNSVYQLVQKIQFHGKKVIFAESENQFRPVSYTHLTLPTICSV